MTSKVNFVYNSSKVGVIKKFNRSRIFKQAMIDIAKRSLTNISSHLSNYSYEPSLPEKGKTLFFTERNLNIHLAEAVYKVSKGICWAEDRHNQIRRRIDFSCEINDNQINIEFKTDSTIRPISKVIDDCWPLFHGQYYKRLSEQVKNIKMPPNTIKAYKCGLFLNCYHLDREFAVAQGDLCYSQNGFSIHARRHINMP